MAFDFRRPGDWPARVIGLAVFLTGVGLLVLVFVWANQSLAAPPMATNEPLNWASLGARLAWGLGRLIVLGFVASAIAGRGVQLYAVAGRPETPARTPLE